MEENGFTSSSYFKSRIEAVGNNLSDEVSYAHTIESSVEILTGQDGNGILQAVRITDMGGVQTLIKFQAN